MAGQPNSDNDMEDVEPIPARNTIVIRDPTLKRGFTIVPNILFAVKGLSHGARLTYVLLLKYAWREGSCYPGIERMAEELEVERKSVIRYTKELAQRRLITVKRRGLSLTNVYYINRLPSDLSENGEIEAEVPSIGLQEVPPRGPAEVPPRGHKEDTVTKIQNGVNNVADKANQPPAGPGGAGRTVKPAGQVRYLVEEILKVCGDQGSRRYYMHVARALPDDVIFRFLSEIKADATVRNRGAVFTSKVKAYLTQKREHSE